MLCATSALFIAGLHSLAMTKTCLSVLAFFGYLSPYIRSLLEKLSGVDRIGQSMPWRLWVWGDFHVSLQPGFLVEEVCFCLGRCPPAEAVLGHCFREKLHNSITNCADRMRQNTRVSSWCQLLLENFSTETSLT